MKDASPIVVRSAREADLPAMHRIYNDAIRDTTATWDEEPWPFATRLAWWDEHVHDPTTPVFVAVRDGKVGGFAYLSWFGRKSGYRFTREDTVYIDPAMHRQGAGRALMTAVVAAAREHGMHAIIARIEATNVASIELHRAMGFVVTGTERETGFKFGRWLDATAMELLLE